MGQRVIFHNDRFISRTNRDTDPTSSLQCGDDYGTESLEQSARRALEVCLAHFAEDVHQRSESHRRPIQRSGRLDVVQRRMSFAKTPDCFSITINWMR